MLQDHAETMHAASAALFVARQHEVATTRKRAQRIEYGGVPGRRQHRRDSFTDLIRSEEHTSELQSQMRISYAVFCLKKKKTKKQTSIDATHTRYNTADHSTT